MEVRWGCSKHTTVGPKHLTLHLDGEVTQPALFPLAVQIVQHSSTGTRETHLDSQTSWSCRSTAGRVHGHTQLDRKGKHKLHKQIRRRITKVTSLFTWINIIFSFLFLSHRFLHYFVPVASFKPVFCSSCTISSLSASYLLHDKRTCFTCSTFIIDITLVILQYLDSGGILYWGSVKTKLPFTRNKTIK